MTTDLSAARPALTTLSEEEMMFRDAVAGFAESEVRPRVMDMERAAKIDPTLIPKTGWGALAMNAGCYGGETWEHVIAAETVDRVLHLVRISEWKRHQAAPGPKVSRRAFGRDRRYPITSGWGR